MTKLFEFELCKCHLEVSSNKTEYYVAFNIVLNLTFFNLNIEHLKFNTINFFMAVF